MTMQYEIKINRLTTVRFRIRTENRHTATVGPVTCNSTPSTTSVELKVGVKVSESTKRIQELVPGFKAALLGVDIDLSSKKVDEVLQVLDKHTEKTERHNWGITPSPCMEIAHYFYQKVTIIDYQVIQRDWLKKKEFFFTEQLISPETSVRASNKQVKPPCLQCKKHTLPNLISLSATYLNSLSDKARTMISLTRQHFSRFNRDDILRRLGKVAETLERHPDESISYWYPEVSSLIDVSEFTLAGKDELLRDGVLDSELISQAMLVGIFGSHWVSRGFHDSTFSMVALQISRALYSPNSSDYRVKFQGGLDEDLSLKEYECLIDSLQKPIFLHSKVAASSSVHMAIYLAYLQEMGGVTKESVSELIRKITRGKSDFFTLKTRVGRFYIGQFHVFTDLDRPRHGYVVISHAKNKKRVIKIVSSLVYGLANSLSLQLSKTMSSHSSLLFYPPPDDGDIPTPPTPPENASNQRKSRMRKAVDKQG